MERLCKISSDKYHIEYFPNWIKIGNKIVTNEEARSAAHNYGWKPLKSVANPFTHAIAWYSDEGDFILQHWEEQTVEDVDYESAYNDLVGVIENA